MAEPLTPPPILNAIAEAPGLLTPRPWSRYFQSVREHVLALEQLGGGTEGPPGPQGEPGAPGAPGPAGPQGDQPPLASTTPPAIAVSGAVGVSTTAARSDHTHAAMATTLQAQIDALNARLTALEQPQLSEGTPT